jgi:hypothetical protein
MQLLVDSDYLGVGLAAASSSFSAVSPSVFFPFLPVGVVVLLPSGAGDVGLLPELFSLSLWSLFAGEAARSVTGS